MARLKSSSGRKASFLGYSLRNTYQKNREARKARHKKKHPNDLSVRKIGVRLQKF